MTRRISPLPVAILASSVAAVSVAVAAPLHGAPSHRVTAHVATLCHKSVKKHHAKTTVKCSKPVAHSARHRIIPVRITKTTTTTSSHRTTVSKTTSSGTTTTSRPTTTSTTTTQPTATVATTSSTTSSQPTTTASSTTSAPTTTTSSTTSSPTTTTTASTTSSSTTTAPSTTTSSTTTTTTSASTTTSSGPVSGGLDVGLTASVTGWGDESARMNAVESQTSSPWLREAFDWSQIEPSNGTYSFSRYDTLMTLASQKGVHILANLINTPSWAGATWNTIPDDPTAFASFTATVVARYGPHGSFWTSHPTLAKDPITTFEILNEPYYSQFDNGDYNPGRYARLVKAAGAAGHAADSSAKFLMAAENQSALVNGTWVWWIDGLYQAVPDLNSYFDGVAVHPYGPDLTSVSYPTPGQAYNGYDQVRRLETIRQEFVNHSASDKPLWITELGWPTCTAGGSNRCTNAAGQASDIQTVFNDARTTWKPYLQAIFLYGYQDNNSNTADPENDYGLVDYSGNPKPSLSVFKTQLSLG